MSYFTHASILFVKSEYLVRHHIYYFRPVFDGNVEKDKNIFFNDDTHLYNIPKLGKYKLFGYEGGENTSGTFKLIFRKQNDTAMANIKKK